MHTQYDCCAGPKCENAMNDRDQPILDIICVFLLLILKIQLLVYECKQTCPHEKRIQEHFYLIRLIIDEIVFG